MFVPAGRGLIERGGPYYKKTTSKRGAYHRVGVNNEVGFNRDFTVKQKPDWNFLKSTFGHM